MPPLAILLAALIAHGADASNHTAVQHGVFHVLNIVRLNMINYFYVSANLIRGFTGKMGVSIAPS